MLFFRELLVLAENYVRITPFVFFWYYQFNKYTLTNQILNCLKRPEFPRPIYDFTLKRNSLMAMIYLYNNVDIIELC